MRIDALIARSGADVGLAFRTLDGRDELLVQPDVGFHAASTMKVPVMIELFRQTRAGTLELDDRIPVANAFHSIVDGSPTSSTSATTRTPTCTSMWATRCRTATCAKR